MKKFLFSLLICAMAFATGTNAQSTSPRHGTGTRDNTFRAMTLAYTTVTDAAGNDSTRINSRVFDATYRVALTDSITFVNPTITGSYAGDRLRIVATGASGKKVKFSGANFQTAGTATLSSGGVAVITFVFTGALWAESGRVVQ